MDDAADDRLRTYLADHLAGARGALGLIAHLREHAADQVIRGLMTTLHGEVDTDRALLEQVAHRLGGGPSAAKEMSAWLGEKIGRLKIGAVGGVADGLPQFEAVEAIALGILGKIALWDTLASAAANPALSTLDYAALRRGAVDQHRRVEDQRRRVAATLFGSGLASRV